MQCYIRKSNINNFQYHCSCDANYVPITSSVNVGCTPFEQTSGFNEIAKSLPKNPLFLKKLGCVHTYEIIDDEYRCKCFDGYTLNEKTGECTIKKKCTKKCGKNQICTIDDQNQSHCTCRTGENLFLF